MDWLDEVTERAGRHTDDRPLPKPAVPPGPRLHHAAQPGDHGLDAHRARGPGARHRPAGSVLRRTRPRRRRAHHHRRLRAQPHRLAAPVRGAAGVFRRRRADTAASPRPCTTRAARSCCRSCTPAATPTTRCSVSASSIKAPINPFRPRKLSDRGVEDTIARLRALRAAGPGGRLRRRRDHGQRGLPAQPVPGAAHQQAHRRSGAARRRSGAACRSRSCAAPARPSARTSSSATGCRWPTTSRTVRAGTRSSRWQPKSRPPGPRIINTGIGWHEARVPTIVTSVPNSAFVDISNAVAEHVAIPVVASNRINMPQVGRADPRRRSRPADLDGPTAAVRSGLGEQGAGRRRRRDQHLHRLQPGLPRSRVRAQDGVVPAQSAGRPRDQAGARPDAAGQAGRGRRRRTRRTVRRGDGRRARPPRDAVRGRDVDRRPIRPGAKDSRQGGVQPRRSATTPGCSTSTASTCGWAPAPTRRRTVGLRRGGARHRVSRRGCPTSPGSTIPMVLSYAEAILGRPVGKTVAVVGAGGIGFDVSEFLWSGADDVSGRCNLKEWKAEWGVLDPRGPAGGTRRADDAHPAAARPRGVPAAADQGPAGHAGSARRRAGCTAHR